MNDPVQMLLDAGAIPTSPFGPSSRYSNVATARFTFPGDCTREDSTVTYVLRRFIPQARDIPVATYHPVHANERVDVLAARYLADAELHWRIADANLAPDLLGATKTPGRRLVIPLPPGS